MEKCKFHKENDAVGKCALCGAELCKECDDFQEQFGRCPNCARQTVAILHKKLKHGLLKNILSVVFATLFLILYVVYLCLGELSTTFIVVGAIIISILMPLTVLMMIYNIKNIKKLEYFLNLAEKKLHDQKENDNKK